jgi:4-hydroxy-tetrahydrodipicolinate synthase
VATLADHPNIVGLKEASGNMSQVVDIIAKCGDKLDIYSGEDALTVAMMSMGGKGCISVLSNVMPRQSVEMTDAAFAGDFKKAAELQCRMLPLIDALFSEVNPIPAKAAVAAMGFGEEYIRMPLTLMEDATSKNLYEQMRKLGVLR